MEFEFTAEQKEFRLEFRDWLESSLPEEWIHGDWNVEFTDENVDFFIEWQQKMDRDGWIAPNWPEEYGGMGLSVVEDMIYRDELARVNAPRAINSTGINYVGPALIELGTDWQKERFIPKILGCEEIWCQGYSEPDAGSDIASLTTRAEREGDEWIINGQKIWTSRMQWSDYCILMARTDFSGTKHEGITAFIVDLHQDGVSHERIRQMNDMREFNQVFYDDVRVPDDHVVGEVGDGWAVTRHISLYEQSGTRAFKFQRRFNELLHFCQNNNRGGQPLAADPHVRRKLAEFDTRIQAAKRSAYRQVSNRIEDPVPGPEGTLDKLTTNELAIDLENFAVSLLGPEAGLWSDGPEDGRWAHDYLRKYGNWIAGGTGDVYHNILGEKVLGLPKDVKSKTNHRSD
jgi:alkylation response protein AidB-like acyl-CoA dehydrogenase